MSSPSTALGLRVSWLGLCLGPRCSQLTFELPSLTCLQL